MRVLVISNLYPPHCLGGYEQACRDTVEGLRRRGHHVDVLTSTYGINHPEVNGGIHRILRLNPLWGEALPYVAALREILRWNRDSHRLLQRLLAGTRPNVVYVWSMHGLPASLLSRLHASGIPLVFNIQDAWICDVQRDDPWIGGWANADVKGANKLLRGWLRDVINPIIATRVPDISMHNAHYVSHAFADLYHSWGRHFMRERVIYNSIDLSKYHSAPRTRLQGPYKLLFVGQLVEHKGAHVAIEAVSTLTQRLGPGAVTLTIVGSSSNKEYQERLHRLVSHLRLKPFVDFRGSMPREAIAAVYADHDTFLFPSKWLEGFSLALLEAVASGLTVVGTTLGGSAEILDDGVTGLTVPPEDPQALAAQVFRVITNPPLASRLAAAGQRSVRERFSEPKIMQQVEEYLQEVVRETRAPCGTDHAVRKAS